MLTPYFALRSRRGASFVILNAIRQELVTGAASQALLLEYADVLTRRENIAAFWADENEVKATLVAIARRLAPIFIDFSYRPLLSDPDDEMILE